MTLGGIEPRTIRHGIVSKQTITLNNEGLKASKGDTRLVWYHQNLLAKYKDGWMIGKRKQLGGKIGIYLNPQRCRLEGDACIHQQAFTSGERHP